MGLNSGSGLTQLLPLHSSTSSSGPNAPKPKAKSTPGRLADVWDEGEDLFDIGEESDEDEGDSQDQSKQNFRTEEGPSPTTPKFVVTGSES